MFHGSSTQRSSASRANRASASSRGRSWTARHHQAMLSAIARVTISGCGIGASQAGDAIVDLGTPLEAARRVVADGSGGSDSKAAGYSLLQADSRETLEALLRDHPHLKMPGASIDILEALPIPGA